MAVLDRDLGPPTSENDTSLPTDLHPNGQPWAGVATGNPAEPFTWGAAAAIVFAPQDVPDKVEIVQFKGDHATVADAVANAPGEGGEDVVTIDGMLHRWDVLLSTYTLEDDKAPVQTDATKDAFALTKEQYDANIIVPYRSPGGSVQFFLPKKDQVDHATWAAQTLFTDKYEPEGGVDAPDAEWQTVNILIDKQNIFTLAAAYASPASSILEYNGQTLRFTSDYTIAGSTLTVTNPTFGDRFETTDSLRLL